MADLTPREIEEALARVVNGGLGTDEFIDALTNEHPTLLGQIAKAVGIAVMRRTMRDPDWKPWDSTKGPSCFNGSPILDIGREKIAMPEHHDHDGRLTCHTVLGAELIARQPVI